MNIRDTIILVIMISIMSFALITTGMVLPTYSYTESGVTYNVVKDIGFVTFYDDRLAVTFGYYLDQEELVFYQTEDNEWAIYVE